jgi:hypothetical protein
MRSDSDKSVSFYTTLDAYQSGFLTLKGYFPKLIDQDGKIVFVFIQSDELLDELGNYNSGAVVEASRFAFAIKTLKGQIHSMRRGRDKGNGSEKQKNKKLD